VVVYEGGEADRFNETAISVGVDGVLRVLTDLGMRTGVPPPPAASTTIVRHTRWVRARRTGILRSTIRAGQRVAKGDVLGIIADAVGDSRATMKAPFGAVVISHTQHPLVNRGDALWHLADLDPAAKGTAARAPRGR
jgi:hypothetical protein